MPGEIHKPSAREVTYLTSDNRIFPKQDSNSDGEKIGKTHLVV